MKITRSALWLTLFSAPCALVAQQVGCVQKAQASTVKVTCPCTGVQLLNGNCISSTNQNSICIVLNSRPCSADCSQLLVSTTTSSGHCQAAASAKQTTTPDTPLSLQAFWPGTSAPREKDSECLSTTTAFRNWLARELHDNSIREALLDSPHRLSSPDLSMMKP